MGNFTKEDYERQADEVTKLLFDSVTRDSTTDRSDYRYNLTGVLNPDNTSYRLPKSHGRFKDILDVLLHKQYTAYYPQSFVALPNYFTDSGIDPYFSPKPWDDYALGAITIAGMIQLNANSIPWILGDADKVGEILDYTRTYLSLVVDSGDTSVRAKQIQFQLTDFIKEMQEGADRIKKREMSQGISTEKNFSLESILKRVQQYGSNVS